MFLRERSGESVPLIRFVVPFVVVWIVEYEKLEYIYELIVSYVREKMA